MHVRLAGAVALATVGIAALSPAARANTDPGKEIAALQAIKRSLTAGERKLDSRLAVALREKQAAPTTEVDALALRLWHLQRAHQRDQFRQFGISVAEWRVGDPLGPTMEALWDATETSGARRRG